jgi:hypothetical protein
MITIRPARLDDVGALKDKLRRSDIEEIWASHNETPESALRKCVEESTMAFVAENGSPIAIFGISSDSLLGTHCSIWMLATDELEKYKHKLFRDSRLVIQKFLDYSPLLVNYVDVRNKKSIQWLSWLGAEFDEPKPYGIEGKLFRMFKFVRK